MTAETPEGPERADRSTMASAAVWKALLVVHGGSPRSQWAKTVEEIARKHPQGKLCILFKDATSPVTPSTLRLVTRSYQAISTVAPRMDLVPLFPAAGWTLVGASKIQDLTAIAIDATAAGSSSDADVSAIESVRAAAGLPILAKLKVGTSAVSAGDGERSPKVNGVNGHANGVGEGEEPLALENVAVGGTFDRLHAGHRLLLSSAALVSSRSVYLGIAGEVLLKHKSNAGLLQPFDERERIAREFILAVRPGLAIDTSELMAGPPKASTMPEMTALVVSLETVAGAELIQKQRREAGFAPVKVITVDLVGAKEQTPTAPKLSSSILREIDAKRMSADDSPPPPPSAAGAADGQGK